MSERVWVKERAELGVLWAGTLAQGCLMHRLMVPGLLPGLLPSLLPGLLPG